MALMGFRSSLNIFIIAETFPNRLNKARYNFLTKMCFLRRFLFVCYNCPKACLMLEVNKTQALRYYDSMRSSLFHFKDKY